ncbi:hypothetical protein BASA81_014437 [Batrachochytrium salamandrivorans]|nr:hypothetical protein BASA81_014437 [Batrachochytrium salamandrivorans]
MRISIATVCSVAIFALPSVTAWGVVAHKTICLIAKEFLTKKGLEYVDAYLHQQPMELIGSWADNDRESYKDYDSPEYHFTNSMDPSEAKCVYDDHRDCADGICLSSAIARHNRILMESTSPDDPGAEESLKYIIHFISDVCQPLHTDGRDEGGSLTLVRLDGQTWSLHTIWDNDYPGETSLDDFKNNPVLYASYLIRSIKTGENKVPSESWTSKLPIDAVNDIGNSMVAIEYTADSYELSCSLFGLNTMSTAGSSLAKKYYGDFFKTVDMQISKAGLRVANWLNQLARLHSQTKVDAATLPAAQPVRLLERSVTKKTLINAICSGTDNDVFTLNVQGQLARSQRWFWSRRTKQLYRNRYWLTPQVRPKTVQQRHSFALMETLRTCGDSASLQKYVTRQLLDTSGFLKDPSFDQSRAHGTRHLMLARMDALWTERKAIQIGILVDSHPFSVDHCILCNQQLLSTSIAHLVVECEQVTGHRIQCGLVPEIQKSRLRLLGRSTRFGCGECIYLAPRWSHKWRSRSGPAVVGRDCGA